MREITISEKEYIYKDTIYLIPDDWTNEDIIKYYNDSTIELEQKGCEFLGCELDCSYTPNSSSPDVIITENNKGIYVA